MDKKMMKVLDNLFVEANRMTTVFQKDKDRECGKALSDIKALLKEGLPEEKKEVPKKLGCCDEYVCYDWEQGFNQCLKEVKEMLCKL